MATTARFRRCPDNRSATRKRNKFSHLNVSKTHRMEEVFSSLRARPPRCASPEKDNFAPYWRYRRLSGKAVPRERKEFSHQDMSGRPNGRCFPMAAGRISALRKFTQGGLQFMSTLGTESGMSATSWPCGEAGRPSPPRGSTPSPGGASTQRPAIGRDVDAILSSHARRARIAQIPWIKRTPTSTLQYGL